MTTNPAPEPGAAPGPIPPTQTVRFPSRDGTALYGEYFAAGAYARGVRAVAVVMHGYAEHCGRYRELGHVLVNSGISALTYDMRGHGRSEGQRGHISDYSDYFDDMNAALAKADELAGETLPRVLVCHSNGSLIGLRGMADPEHAPDRLLAAVLSSPFLGLAMKVNPIKTMFGKLAGRFLPTLSLPNEIKAEHLTHDPMKVEEHRIDTLCHDVASARWFALTVEAQDWVREFIGRLKTPTLWLVAGGDRIADPALTRAVHARVRAPSVYREFPDMHHEVFNEVDRGDAFAMITAFFDERIPEKS